tara:strand:+ start:571 stop:903 length:333 start_codon:yes stop_codon:yes gene_type:complete
MKLTLTTEEAVDVCMRHDVLGADKYTETSALVEYLEALECEIGELEMDLDPIHLKCQFAIYTLAEAAKAYLIDTSGAKDAGDRDYIILQHLRDNTTVIEVNETTVIVGEF